MSKPRTVPTYSARPEDPAPDIGQDETGRFSIRHGLARIRPGESDDGRWRSYLQNARVEVIDLFHFLISLAQTLGMSADDVFEAYVKKNAVNHQRQDSGYEEKDHGDSKHI